MIISLFFVVGGTILQLINFLLSGIGSLVPQQVHVSLFWLFENVNMLSGIFPVQVLMSACLTILSVWIGMYGVRLILWGIGFIPGVGSHAQNFPSALPNNTDLRPHPSNQVDLSYGNRPRGRIDKRMRF